MKLYKLFLFFLCAILFLTSCGVGRSLRQAEQSYARGEYFDAARHYKTAYTRTPPKDRSQRGVLAYKQCYSIFYKCLAVIMIAHNSETARP